MGAHTGDIVEVETAMPVVMKYKVLEIQRNDLRSARKRGRTEEVQSRI